MPHQWTTTARTGEILTPQVVNAANRIMHGDYGHWLTVEQRKAQYEHDANLCAGAIGLLLVERDKVTP